MRQHTVTKMALTVFKATWNFFTISVGYLVKGGEWNQMCDQNDKNCLQAIRNGVPVGVAGSTNLIARWLVNQGIDCLSDREIIRIYRQPAITFLLTIMNMGLTFALSWKLDLDSTEVNDYTDRLLKAFLISLFFTVLDETEINLLKLLSLKCEPQVRNVETSPENLNLPSESTALIPMR